MKSNKTGCKTEQQVLENRLIPYFLKLDVSCKMIECALEAFCENFFEEEILRKRLEEDVFLQHLFIIWMFFHWVPYEFFEDVKAFNELETVAWNYLKSHKKQLKPSEKLFFEKMKQTFFSFYRVEVVNEKTVKMEDFFLSDSYVIEDPLLAHYLRSCVFVFANLLKFEQRVIFMGGVPLHLSLDVMERKLNHLEDSLTSFFEEEYFVDDDMLCDGVGMDMLLDAFFDVLSKEKKTEETIIECLQKETTLDVETFKTSLFERFYGAASFEKIMTKMHAQKTWGEMFQSASQPLFEENSTFIVDPKKE